MAALSLPLLIAVVAASLNYTTVSGQKTRLQRAADAAALAAAQEMRLVGARLDRLQAVAQSVASSIMAQDGDKSVPTVTLEKVTHASAQTKAAEGVRITVTQPRRSAFPLIASDDSQTLTSTAVAVRAGTTNLCILGLHESAAETISLKGAARLSAPGCTVHVNSGHGSAVKSIEEAVLTSLTTCSAGGYHGGGGNFRDKAPITDCPRLADPLAARPQPLVGNCNHTNLVIQPGIRRLQPGVYCGGLTLRPGAIVSLAPGIYVMKDGPLVVGPPVATLVIGTSSNGLFPAVLKGDSVGFFFTGTVKPEDTGAVVPLRFTKGSVVELTAPRTGPLAGMLLFEDRASLPERRFEVSSDEARRLVGTIYLPKGVFSVSANQRVADQSEYTAVVARRIELSQAPNLVLNTRYFETDVPVPDGLGPSSGRTHLVQ